MDPIPNPPSSDLAKKQNVVIENVCKDFTTCLREERIVRREELMILRNELKEMHSREDYDGSGE